MFQDSDALSRMQQAVLNIQAELERLDKVTQQLMDENLRKQKDIEVSGVIVFKLSACSHVPMFCRCWLLIKNSKGKVMDRVFFLCT